MQMDFRKLSELKMHPVSLNIYGKDEDVADLVKSIRGNDLLTPLTVKPDGTILSGNRRYRAAVELGLEEVPCVTAEPQSPEEEDIFIVEANKNRVKNDKQLYKEIKRLEAAYAALDGRKQRRKKNDGSYFTKDEPCISASLAELSPGKKPARNKRTVSAMVADAIGMKERCMQRLKYVGDRAAIGNETAAQLLIRVEKENLPLGTAERLLKKSLKVQAADGEPEREKTLFEVCVEQAGKNVKQLLCTLDKLAEIPDDEYNPFLCDSFRDELRFLPQAIARLDEKERARRQAREQKPSAAGGESAA